jgi:MinD-like ATPase involved in chromosome partitioning or flagellar assembly
MKAKRLGRGLEEISHVFLSSEPTPVSQKDPGESAMTAPPSPPPTKPVIIPTLAVTGGSHPTIGIFALCNIAIELARQGYRILVVDDDPGGGNVTRMMGSVDIESHGEAVFHRAPMGVRIAYRTPLLNDLAVHGHLAREEKGTIWPEQYRRFDFILVHCPPRREGDLGPLLRRVSRCIVLGSTAADEMLETYSVIKGIHQCALQTSFGLIAYVQKPDDRPEEAFQKMARSVRRFLHKDLVSYAYIQKEKEILDSIERKAPLSLKWPSSEVRRQIFNISGLIVEDYYKKTS